MLAIDDALTPAALVPAITRLFEASAAKKIDASPEE